MACCRWLCAASVRTYAHMNPGDYRRHLQDAVAAPITSRLASTLASRITLDNDAAAHAVSAEFGKDSDADGAIAVPDTSPPASPAAATPRVHGRRRIRPSSEVHCPGILGARRAADMHWKVALYNGDAGFVRRDRLFAVVDLAAA